MTGSKSTFWNRIPRTVLLQIDKACDRYEADLDTDSAKALQFYVAEIDAAFQEAAISELRVVEENWAATEQAEHDEVQFPASDRFQPERSLGQGGSGSVWKARDLKCDRVVAIKLLKRPTDSSTQRLKRESEIVGRLDHPNIVPVHEFLEIGERHALVSEFVDGETLGELHRRSHIPLIDAIHLLIEVCDAVQHAHEHGVIHRDIKPHNILISEDGTPFVTDFGIARDDTSNSATITATGEVLGTPAFMAPEQARGENKMSDSRTDVYALGAVLFYLLTGDVPFRGSIASVIHQVAFIDVPSPRQWDNQIPRDIETVCLKCLEKSPDQRFQSVSELRDELIRFAHGEPVRSRPLNSSQRFWRWCCRHPQVAGLSAAVCVLLISVAVGSTFVASRMSELHRKERVQRLAAVEAQQSARNAERRALASKQTAEKEADRAVRESHVARQAVDFLQRWLVATDPMNQLHSAEEISETDVPTTQQRASLLVAADRVYTELDAQPDVQATVIDTLANACRGVGLYGKAAELLSSAEQLRTDEASVDVRARHQFFRGWLAQDLGQFDEAEGCFQSALRTLSEDEEFDVLRSQILFQYAQVQHAVQQTDQAVSSFAECLRLRERQFPKDSTPVLAARTGLRFCKMSNATEADYTDLAKLVGSDGLPNGMIARYLIMQGHRAARDYERAADLYKGVITDLTGMLGADHPIRILAVGEYAGVLFEQGDFATANVAANDAIKRGARLAPNHPKLRGVLIKLGYEYLRAERIEDARRCFSQCLTSFGRSEFCFDSHLGLAWAELEAGNANAAYSYSELLVSERHRFMIQATAWIYYTHALILQRLDREAEARRYFDLAYEEASKTPELSHSIWQSRIATIFAHHGDNETAATLQRRALAIVEGERPADHPRVADRQMALALVLRRLGEEAEATSLAAKALAIRKKQLPSDDIRIRQVKDFLDGEKTDQTRTLASGQSI